MRIVIVDDGPESLAAARARLAREEGLEILTADAATYAAKQQGRNRVCCTDASPVLTGAA